MLTRGGILYDDDSQFRIHTIAEMYDHMLNHGEVSQVNLGPYLEDLIATLGGACRK